MKFTDLGLSDEVLRAIHEAGYEEPTPIQEKAIPVVLMGRDVLGCAQTGTGKTAAFLISVLTYHLENPEYDPRPPGAPFALVIAPTRELVMQIADDAVGLSLFTDIDIISVVGGMDY